MKNHPANKHGIYSINDLQAHYERKTRGHWFSPGAMSFFKTRLSEELYYSDSVIYFVTSEKGPDDVRAYSLRSYDSETGALDTVGEFQAYATLARAKNAAKNAIKGDNQ